MLTIKEGDWKILSSLKPVLLERFCEIALFSASEIIDDGGKTFHERYLNLYSLIMERDKALGLAFDDITRSKAFSRIAFMREADLLTDDEYGRFTQETQAIVNDLIKSYGPR